MKALTTSLHEDLVGSYEPVMVAEGTMPPLQPGGTTPHPDADLLALCHRYADAGRQ